MKLNLLPTHVSKSGQAKSAMIASLIMVVASIAAAVFLLTSSKAALAKVKEEAYAVKPDADLAVAIAKKADDLINGRPPYKVPAPLIARNTALANAMLDHSKVYPDLYREVVQYVPDFFRVTSLQAQPMAGGQVAQVNITGIIHTFQQYADLMIALLRIPGAVSVSRSGYTNNDMYVPELILTDQIGIPIRPDQPRLSSNALDRLNEMIAAAAGQTGGFQNIGGFGTEDVEIAKGAMPGWSEINVTVLIIGRNLQTPNPRATLSRAPAPAGNTTAPGPGNPGAGGPPPSGPPPSRPRGGDDE